jgi:sucrose phosphorylase
LGNNEQKLVLARAIQIFMPGIPQVWYLDLFAGKNDYAAADAGGTSAHKEINRTNLTLASVQKGLKNPVVLNQIEIIRIRNTSMAFRGRLRFLHCERNEIHLEWIHLDESAILKADLRTHNFEIFLRSKSGDRALSFEGGALFRE